MAVSILCAGPVSAFQPASSRALEQAYPAPELDVEPSLVRYEVGAPLPPGIEERLSRFFTHYSDQWEVRWDLRSDRPHMIQGAGIPLLPGAGNSLLPADVGLPKDGHVELAEVERLVRGFLGTFPEVLGVDPRALRLDPSSSLATEGGRLWVVELQQLHGGVPVEGARVFFRINSGNIVQFGADRVAEVRSAGRARLGKEAALPRARAALSAEATAVAEVVDPGTLKVYPTLLPGEAPGEEYRGDPGRGYRHRLLWEVALRLRGDAATYQVLLDAASGDVVRLIDLNRYADALVQGGIYPVTNTDPEEVQPFGFANVTNNGTQTTNAVGIYNYTPGTATSTLNGRFFRMNDNCGAISLSNGVDGNLSFGTSGGTDCTTPGIGGLGNTHSSRTGFYHLTRINRKAINFLPSNAWLQTTVQANMNINNTCNAFWNGVTVNFYRSGGGCSNTGEISAVFLHEWGHGLDTNTGGSASENGSGEAVGDTFAFLQTRDGCIGDNFRPGVDCHNCNACTGVRDVSDFDVDGPATVARPNTVTSDSGINCDRFLTTGGQINCPYLTNGGAGSPYRGPMGYEGHCESYIASSSNWDLVQELIAAYGVDPAWARMDKIWYSSLTPSKSAYRLVSGGQCNPSAVVDGCGATNWYTVFLPVDDDDGNLANGTPSACRIWDAFNAHGIACGTQPVCHDAIPAAPTALQASSQRLAVSLTWAPSSSPDVTGYRVYRSLAPGGPYSLIGSPTAPSLPDVAPGYLIPLYYVVRAVDLAPQESSPSAEVTITARACLGNSHPGPCGQ
jgi:hypothetical protein